MVANSHVGQQCSPVISLKEKAKYPGICIDTTVCLDIQQNISEKSNSFI